MTKIKNNPPTGKKIKKKKNSSISEKTRQKDKKENKKNPKEKEVIKEKNQTHVDAASLGGPASINTSLGGKKEVSKINSELSEEKKSNKCSNISKWKIAASVSGILFFILIIFAILFLNNFYSETFRDINSNLFSSQKEKKEEVEKKCENCVRRFIDGVYVEDKENPYPIAVMIDNNPEAYPHFGLDLANLVYEAPVEGVTSRYMAIFASDISIEKIGPVRSARPYFLDWTQELGAVYTHCGGSPEALTRIIRENVIDLNEFYNAAFFWRGNDKKAPHNIYTSSERLNKFLQKNNLKTGKYFSWNFKDETNQEFLEEEKDMSSTSTKDIEIDIPCFSVKWKYDRENNDYVRYLWEDKHVTGDANEIRSKNIVIQFVKSRVLDDELRLKINTTGQGKAIICLDSQCKEGIWKKNNISSRTRYYYDNDEEVEFNVGTTWIEVVKNGSKINY